MSELINETTMSQRDMILRYMEDFGSITPAQAMDEFGCYRLSARIWDIRNHLGRKVRAEMVERVNRYGHKTRFAKYSLDEEEQNDAGSSI